jgi:hypothetical protein
MTLRLDEARVQRELAPLLDDPGFRQGISVLVNDPFFLAYFLMSVSEGEALGESAVALIGQEELARRIRDLKKQELEERGHKQQTLEVARELFPDVFDGGRYRYEGALHGRTYYVAVLEKNRARLEQAGRYSRLNLYLTTTFAYEIMVLLLYRAVADAVASSSLPWHVRERAAGVLEGILREEQTHLGVIDEHNALLQTPRGDLSEQAAAMLDALESVTDEDYAFPARLAVEQIVSMMGDYAQPGRYRQEIEAGART